MDSDSEKNDVSMNESQTDVSFEKSKSDSSSNRTPNRRKLSKYEMSKRKELIKKEKEIKAKEREIQQNQRKEKIQREKDERRIKAEREKEEKSRVKEEREREKREKTIIREKERLEKQSIKDEMTEKKRQKEEERQRKYNEKIKMEEIEKRKLEKSREMLSKFFTKGTDDCNKIKKISDDCVNESKFLPFQLKKDQTIAQIVPDFVKERFVMGAFDSSVQNQDSDELYIRLLRFKYYIPFKTVKQLHALPDVIIDDSEKELKTNKSKYKHLQFHENVRPAYHGTWTKKSKLICGRRPFGKDAGILDYNIDSDDEWDENDEEGGRGESLDGSDSESSQKGDDYEIDEFFVPHGYLSHDEDDDEGTHDKDQNTKGPLIKEKMLMAERNKTFEKLTPFYVGCVWESSKLPPNKAIKLLEPYKRVLLKLK